MTEDSEIGFYSIAQLVSTKGKIGILPFSRATVFRMVKNGTFPQPIREFKANVWPKGVIHNYIVRLEKSRYEKN